MKNLYKLGHLSILLIAITTGSSFTTKRNFNEEYAIVCHSGYLNVIPRSQLDAHLAHGDTERPYSADLHRSIIESEEDGAGITCR